MTLYFGLETIEVYFIFEVLMTVIQKNKTGVNSDYFQLDQCMASVAEGLKSRYGGPFDSTLLSHIFPIFAAGFKHSRRSIRNEAVTLWQDTFAQQSSLAYPSELKYV